MKDRGYLYLPKDLAAKASDVLTAFAGSWAFVGVHAGWFAGWLILHQDINLLTLIVSLEAIFLATFVLMSQNRSAQRDQARDDHEAEEVDLLYQINQQQLDILQEVRGIINELHVARRYLNHREEVTHGDPETVPE